MPTSPYLSCSDKSHPIAQTPKKAHTVTDFLFNYILKKIIIIYEKGTDFLLNWKQSQAYRQIAIAMQEDFLSRTVC